jgi:hypothetical protein
LKIPAGWLTSNKGNNAQTSGIGMIPPDHHFGRSNVCPNDRRESRGVA